jgi:hypothetical protein
VDNRNEFFIKVRVEDSLSDGFATVVATDLLEESVVNFGIKYIFPSGTDFFFVEKEQKNSCWNKAYGTDDEQSNTLIDDMNACD